ncbi:MAG TPA: lytic murein transglycosylase [Nitrospiria bacterium]|jgi:membrane-bound lytic murein transglycosylase B
MSLLNRKEIPPFQKTLTVILIGPLVLFLVGVLVHQVGAHSMESSVPISLNQAKYKSLLKELQLEHGFDRQELEVLFKKAKFQTEIPEKFAKPAESRSYDAYRPLFIKPEIVQRGKLYLKEHQELFREVKEKYGVEPEVIAAILGVETKFGQRTHGGYSVFDALNSTFTGVPKRESFARKELIHFLILSREEQWDPLGIKGSYAGAMGIPQFIPSSYRHFTVDFDHDGKRDLWLSEKDILASVANYLKIHGWKEGAPIKLPLNGNPQKPSVQKLLREGMDAKTSVKTLKKAGIEMDNEKGTIDDNLEVSLMAYPTENGQERAVLFPNFRTILTYNRAVNYALVVSDLADLLREEPN